MWDIAPYQYKCNTYVRTVLMNTLHAAEENWIEFKL